MRSDSTEVAELVLIAASSEGSDDPAHTHSFSRAFASRIHIELSRYNQAGYTRKDFAHIYAISIVCWPKYIRIMLLSFCSTKCVDTIKDNCTLMANSSN